MQGKGRALRTLALLRVCSNTQDFETLSRDASSAGVRISAGSNLGGPVGTVTSCEAAATFTKIPSLAEFVSVPRWKAWMGEP
jgi:hypothetical protein